MGDYDNSGLVQITQPPPSQSPGPAGLNQAASAGSGHGVPGNPYANSSLGYMVQNQGLAGASGSWYTGGNAESTENGWFNPIINEFIPSWNDALEKGTARDYFDDGNAGVVTWDHTGKSGTRYEWGDIYDKSGKKVGNVYDQWGEDAGNILMAEFVFDKTTKAEIYSDDDRLGRLKSEIASARSDREKNFADMLDQAAFQGEVTETKDSILGGWADDAITIGAGALSGVLTGGLLGAAGANPVTVGIGGVAGGVVGGYGAYANRDALAEQAARAYEITELSMETEGKVQGVFTGIHQFSGFGAKLISPMSNLTQGIYDQVEGKGGDGQSEFYRTDETGQRTAPAYVRGLDVAATVGDSLVQFASPVGLALFSTQMSGTIAGEVGELATTGGKSFDYRTGKFDNIFTDDEGNFDLMSGAAGIGKIGIDAVQLGMARGLAGSANAQRVMVGDDAAYGVGAGLLNKVTGGAAGRIAGKVDETLPLWMGGSRGLAEGERRVRTTGMSFTQKASGEIVEGSGRYTLGIMAPSEQLAALSSRVRGMRQAAKRDGSAWGVTYSADDFYRAAQGLASGERKIQTALVNAMGEGYEEAMQAVLEPLSHNAGFTAGEVGESALYGFAAGLGMGMGINAKRPNPDSQMFSMARLVQPDLTKAQWSAMTEVEKRTMAGRFDGITKATAEAAYQKIVQQQATDLTGGVEALNKLVDSIQGVFTQKLAKISDATDGYFVVTQLQDAGQVDELGNLLPGSMPTDAVGSSGWQAAYNLNEHLNGIGIQLATLNRDLEQVEARIAADPSNTGALEEKAALEKQIVKTTLTVEWGKRLADVVTRHVTRMYDPAAGFEDITAEVEDLNAKLRNAFNRKIDAFDGEVMTDADKNALARAVSMVFVREPRDQAGSYQMLVPQVSPQLTMEREFGNNVLQISHAILPAIRGDFDGDKIRPANQIILDDEAFTAARAGDFYLGAGASVNVKAPAYEDYVVDLMAESLTDETAARGSAAMGALIKVSNAVRARYGSIIDTAVLDEILSSWMSSVKAGDSNARQELLDGLAGKAGSQIRAYARDGWSNEWLWLDQLIGASFQQFQTAYAANAPALTTEADLGENRPRPVPRVSPGSVRTRRQDRAAVLGQTLSQMLPGESLFRKFQKLHYSSYLSPVRNAGFDEATDRYDLRQMVQLYEELGQGITRSELAEARGKDDLTARVYSQLQRLAADAQNLHPNLSKMESMALVANLRVQDVDVSENGEVTSNNQFLSLAQMLLKRELDRDRANKAGIWNDSPELQAKHARLRGMTRPQSRDYPVNAERAFVEVMGSQQLYTLLGDSAGVFGANLTVEQYVRKFTSLSEFDRREEYRKLRNEPEYLGRKRTKDMPYTLDEVYDKDGEPQLSAYRAVVDAITAVASNRITINTDANSGELGKLKGELANRSNSVSKSFRAVHSRVKEALAQTLELSPRREGETNTDLVQRLLTANPDFARQMYELIPNSAAGVVIETRDGEVFVSNWVYEMFAMEDAREAEMHYWRNLLIAEWRAMAVNFDTETEEGESGREYGKLNRRMHRIMYRLHPDIRRDGGVAYQQFIDKLMGETDLSEFIKWVNTTPGIRGREAPLTAWVDDVAEFDMDKAQGGWTTSLQGAELREAINSLKSGAERLVDTLNKERESIKADAGVRSEIRRAVAVRRGKPGARVVRGDEDTLKRFIKAIQLAGQLPSGTGPEAMSYQIMGALLGFYPQAHTKGKNPDYVRTAGLVDAQREAYGYTTNYERVLSSLTSVSLDAVGGQLGQLAKGGLRTMDDHGRPVAWDLPVDPNGEPTLEAVEKMLDLFENADTRPLARAILFPQVLERTADGRIMPQMVVGRSLRDFLDGTAYKSLFPKNDKLSRKQARKYISMIESLSAKYGGHFAVQRAINDIVIARTSSADHVLSFNERKKMVDDATYEVAQILQLSGSLASRAADSGTDPMGDLYEKVRQVQREAQTRRSLPEALGSKTEVDATLQVMLEERKIEAENDKKQLYIQLRKADATGRKRIQKLLEEIDAEVQRLEERIGLLSNDNVIETVVAMWMLPPDPVDAIPMKKALVEYVDAHRDLIERAGTQKILLRKVTNSIDRVDRDGELPPLKDDEWQMLSRTVISAYLDTALYLSGPNISVQPYPDLYADKEDAKKKYRMEARYFDTSFSYLAEPLLTADSPLVQAAKELHSNAGRQGDFSTLDSDMLSLLGRTLFDDFSVGRWTSDIPTMSIAANQRLDSAGAEPGITIPGNSVKRQAAVVAATRRTFQVPGEELLSRITMSGNDLERPLFDPFSAILPGDRPANMPLAQLNNRFARSAVARFINAAGEPVEVDLLTEIPDTGRPFVSNDIAYESGYQEIHVDRLRRAIGMVAEQHRVDADTVMLDIEFFHPDSQPDGSEWYNNLFFEGTSFRLDADRHPSLLATLWFAGGSLSPEAQAASLDANKLGKTALHQAETVRSDLVASTEEDFLVDLAAVLRDKVQLLMETELGTGKLINENPEFYNAIYKDMKLRHFVRGLDVDGEPTLFTAETIIAMQARGEEMPAEATLWIPTDEVLRSMLGEQGTMGVARYFGDQLEVDLSRVPTYQGISPTMVERFKEGLVSAPLPIDQTRISNRARQSQLSVSGEILAKQQGSYELWIKRLNELRVDVQNDRSDMRMRDDAGFSTKKNLKRAISRADTMLRAENIAFDWAGLGLPYGPRRPADTAMSRLLLHELDAAMDADNGLRTGWVYRQGAPSQVPTGLLSEEALSQLRGGMRIAPGDLVVIELDSFNDDYEKAIKAVDYFVDHGATVVLGAVDGTRDLAPYVAEHLDTRNYERVPGSSHVYRPLTVSPRSQNLRARASALTEMRGVSPRSHVAILNVLDREVAENAAWARAKDKRLGAIAVQMNLVPVDFMADFNVPVESTSDPNQIEDVRQHLFGMDNPEGRGLLVRQANARIEDADQRAAADESLLDAFDKLLARLRSNPGTILPQPGDTFGTGDLIPLTDSRGRVLLYRHGYKAPKNREAVEALLAMTLPNETSGANVAVFPSEQEPAATHHTGTVVNFNPRSGHGLSVELEIDLQTLGDKVQLEWNGMKYVLTPRPDSVQLPEFGVFDDWDISIIASMHDVISKEALDGLVDNHRNAFAYFGIDFTRDVTEYFFPGQGNSSDAQRATLELLNALAVRAPRIPVAAADEMLKAAAIGPGLRDLLPTFALENSDLVDDGWFDRLGFDNLEAQIATSMILYLMTPGARVSDVIKSGGFSDTTSDIDNQSILMPRLFTQVFDQQQSLRTEMNKRFNAQLNRASDDTGYVLYEDFTFEVRNTDPGRNMRGWLQFAEVHSSGDNPIKNGMSFDTYGRQGLSQHTAAMDYEAIGARPAYSYDWAKAQRFADSVNIERFTEKDALDGGVWRMLTSIKAEDKSYAERWRPPTPAETERLNNAREAVALFRNPISQKDENLWSEKERLAYRDRSREIMQTLRLKGKQAEIVDYWVRQVLGAPLGKDNDGNLVGQIIGKDAVATAEDILWNVQHGYLPTVGGEVSLLHTHDLDLIFRANKNQANPWRPKEGMGLKTEAVSWTDWVYTSLGGSLTADQLFDPLYLLAFDGFFHSYRSILPELKDLPASIDAKISELLVDPNTNRLKVSIDDNTDLLATEPILLETANASLSMLLGDQRIAGRMKAQSAPTDAIAKRRAARRKWRRENDIPIPVDVSMRNFRKNGFQAVNVASNTNALTRMLIDLRVGTALFNPALFVSMGPEQWVRGTLDRLANVATGQATVGRIARGQAKRSEKRETRAAEEAGRTERRQAAQAAEQDVAREDRATVLGQASTFLVNAGFTTRFTPDQLAKLGPLYSMMGKRADFKSLLYRELHFRRPYSPTAGRVERALDKYAQIGSRLQDPTYGMPGSTLARRYVEAALQTIAAEPRLNVITTDQLIAELSTDPLFLSKRMPEVHEAAEAALSQIRSLKDTPLSLMLRGFYEPLSESENGAFNFAGNVLLKIPLIFSGYGMNVATTITGMQGASDMFAMFAHGRKKGPGNLFARIQTKLRDPSATFTAEEDARIDMSSVLEGIDLSRSFIRGGLTHTGLFVLGMMAGGLNLSGEDEEARKRRLMARHQGVPHIYDPRDMANDIRDAESMYLGFLPDWIAGYGSEATGFQALFTPHWMLKQFLSPLMGIEKFFETGDVRQIMWGYEDAIGSFPLINTMMWDDTVSTAHQLAELADQEAKKGGDTNMIASMGLLAKMVSNYEYMLFENAALNAVYVGIDEWDRDPYALPLRDSDGDIQKDIANEPRPNDLALERYMKTYPGLADYLRENPDSEIAQAIAKEELPIERYLDPETGELKEGYANRTPFEASIRALTENRFTLGAILQLGAQAVGVDDPDYLRYAMPIKLRKQEKAPFTQKDAEGVVLAAYAGTGGQEFLTRDEVTKILKTKFIQAEDWDRYNNLEAEVDAFYASQKQPALAAWVMQAEKRGLSVDDGVSIFKGLASGQLPLGDEDLGNVYITYEMREQIEARWTKQIIAEGVELGLDESQALSRFKRIWYGDIGATGAKRDGLGDLLWSKSISAEDSVTYKQRNTEYITGPNGLPLATGYERGGVLGALGIKFINPLIVPDSSATGLDERWNVTDLVNGRNTGLRAVVPLHASEYIRTDIEIGKAIEDAIKSIASDAAPFTPYDNKSSGNGWRNFGGYGGYGGYRRRSYGGGGYGGGGGGSAYFTRMNPLPTATTPYSNDTPFINTSNPIIRRADVRRERVWSERGRLKQWQ